MRKLIPVLALMTLVGCGAQTGTPAPTTTSIEPSPTAAATEAAEASPDPTCILFDSEDVYLANAGTLPLTFTVPGAPDAPWRGKSDGFFLGKGSCTTDVATASPFFHASVVGNVYADNCHWKTSTVEVPTAFRAAQVLARQLSLPTRTPVETHVGAFRATRLDIELPAGFETEACDEGKLKLFGEEEIVPGVPLRVYVAEVDGTTLVIIAGYDKASATPADLEAIDSILASLRIDM